jgi:pimeloyl-ACP methyl ester carboxylesterase
MNHDTHRTGPRVFHYADDAALVLRHVLDDAFHALRPRRALTMPAALSAVRKVMRSHTGHALSYYEDKAAHGRPLVLIHSINACASAFEMKPLFEHFRESRPVYAPDLPGFGLSNRDPREYSPELYATELTDFLTRVKDKGDAPDVVALSLSSELVARVALARKDLVHTMTFISPTGLSAKDDKRGQPMLESKAFAHSSSHWWSPIAFRAIASRPSVRHFLGKSFVGAPPQDLCSYAFATAHQPGAEHAPLAFLSGRLFTPGIFAMYASLERPVLTLYDRDGYTTFERLDELLGMSPTWRKARIAPTRGMPHFERLEETVAAMQTFWQDTAHRPHHA